VAFDFYDADGDRILSVLDLIRMQTSFDDASAIGREIGELLDTYQKYNVRPKYVKEPLTITFERFH
jgi:Ca2+-binding EF-hand superfamily protein